MINRIVTFFVVLLLTAAFPLSKAEALKLVTYSFEGDTRIGAVVGDSVIDLNLAYLAMLKDQGDPRPRAMANAIVPPDMLEPLQGEERSMAAAKKAVAFAQKQPASRMRAAGILKDLKAVTLKAPIPRPSKITLMGFNFRKHAAEMLERSLRLPCSSAPIPVR